MYLVSVDPMDRSIQFKNIIKESIVEKSLDRMKKYLVEMLV